MLLMVLCFGVKCCEWRKSCAYFCRRREDGIWMLLKLVLNWCVSCW